jgi:hypothetical protein
VLEDWVGYTQQPLTLSSTSRLRPIDTRPALQLRSAGPRFHARHVARQSPNAERPDPTSATTPSPPSSPTPTATRALPIRLATTITARARNTLLLLILAGTCGMARAVILPLCAKCARLTAASSHC